MPGPSDIYSSLPTGRLAPVRTSLQSKSAWAALLVRNKALLRDSSLVSGLLGEVYPELNKSCCRGWRKDFHLGLTQGPKTECSASALLLPWFLGYKQVSSSVTQENWFSLHSLASFLKPSEGDHLWGRLWRPDIQDLVCDVFTRKSEVSSSYNTSEDDVVWPAVSA